MQKIGFIFLTVLLFLFLINPSFVLAAPKKNPNFLTFEKANELIQTQIKSAISRFNSILNRLTNLENSYKDLNLRVTQLEKEVKELKSSSMKYGQIFDQNSPQLGIITYQGNTNELHLWFTPVQPVLSYIQRHLYHVIYQVSVENPSEWCPGTIPVVNRPPYNLFTPAGTMVYTKIYDLTTNSGMLCF